MGTTASEYTNIKVWRNAAALPTDIPSLPPQTTILNSLLPNSIQTCVLLLLFLPLNLKLIKFFNAFSHIIGQKIFIQIWQHMIMIKFC